MKKKCFVLCDGEQEYASRLSSMLAKRVDYQSHLCSSLKEVEKIAKEKEIGILLLEETQFEEGARKLADKTILLVRNAADDDGKESVFKYQSFEEILAEILAICAEDNQRGVLKQTVCKECSLLGVYSPLGRIGKSTFAVALGKAAAKRERVLYLNLEAYSGWEERTARKESYTLGDLLYYAKQEKGNLEMRVGAMTGYLEELAYIAPMEMSEDLKAVTAKEWLELLDVLQSRRLYQKIIIDFSECVQGLWELLSMCSVIYMPVKEGRISRAKLMQFEKNARLLGKEEVLDKTVRLQLGKEVAKDVKRILKRKEWNDGRAGKTP